MRREHMVADVGAGTGMLAELFLEHGNAVVAIEPNDAYAAMGTMRTVSRTSHKDSPSTATW